MQRLFDLRITSGRVVLLVLVKLLVVAGVGNAAETKGPKRPTMVGPVAPGR